jgi:CheY-like chemotaxis protein
VRKQEPRVLVVDDDADARAIYGGYLAAAGCGVRTAVDGREALYEVKRFRPHVIVMDLAMPVLDGWSAISALKRDRRTRHIPVVALSCVQLSRATARSAGCDAFLAKPCLPELVWWQVRALLNRRLRRAKRPREMKTT